MSTRTRIYCVTHPDGRQRLIRATSAPQAITHAARELHVRVASQSDLERLLPAGTQVEAAGNAAAQA